SQLDNRHQLAPISNTLGDIFARQHDVDAAEHAYTAAIEVCHVEGYPNEEIYGVFGLSKVARLRGHSERVEELVNRSLELLSADEPVVLLGLDALRQGQYAQLSGDMERARQHYQAGLTWRGRVWNEVRQFEILVWTGQCAREDKNWAEAER